MRSVKLASFCTEWGNHDDGSRSPDRDLKPRPPEAGVRRTRPLAEWKSCAYVRGSDTRMERIARRAASQYPVFTYVTGMINSEGHVARTGTHKYMQSFGRKTRKKESTSEICAYMMILK
jgi:hypothetical protein